MPPSNQHRRPRPAPPASGIVVSFTGIYGRQRQSGKQMVEDLGGVYSGALQPGITTHLVVGGDTAGEQQRSEKVLLAQKQGIPIVRYQWLEDSAAQGLLEHGAYVVVACEAPLPESLPEPSPEQLRGAAVPCEEQNALFVNPLYSCGPSGTREQGIPTAAPPRQRGKAGARRVPVPALLPTPPPPQNASAMPAQPGPLPSGDMNAAAQAIAALPGEGARGDMAQPEAARRTDPKKAAPAAATGSAAQAEPFTAQRPAAPAASPEESPSPAPERPVLAATVRPGAPLPGRPAQVVLEDLRAQHGRAAAAAKFFISAAVQLSDGRELHFAAGSITHGAMLLYDVNEERDRRCYARTLIRAIYQLPGRPGQTWMQHHYLFAREDQIDRQAELAGSEGSPPPWLVAVKRCNLGPKDVAISASGGYHSPMHLVAAEFAVQWPDGSGAGVRPGLSTRYHCCHAIDTATGRRAALDRVQREMLHGG